MACVPEETVMALPSGGCAAGPGGGFELVINTPVLLENDIRYYAIQSILVNYCIFS